MNDRIRYLDDRTVEVNDNFVLLQAAWLARNGIANYEEAVAAGRLAVIQAIRDGEIVGGRISRGAKTFIRREMTRAAGYHPRFAGLTDFGYCDGRSTKRGPRVTARNRKARRRHRMMLAGLCTVCGRKPESDRAKCNRCGQKHADYQRRSRNGAA